MSANRGVVHWAARHDLLIWLLTLGRERRFRERLLEPARLEPGEVDFAGARQGSGPRMHFHRHGHVEPRALVQLVSDSGLSIAGSGAVGQWALYYVVGTLAS